MNTVIRRTIALMAALGLCLTASTAMAGPYDLEMSRFVDFEIEEIDDQGRVWGFAEGQDDNFDDLTRDLGLVLAPRLIAPSETLGQAGFAVKAMTSFSAIPHQEDYWRDATDEPPSAAMFTSHLQVRKGLPMSLELAGNLTHLARSQMFAMGSDLRWALHEGYRYFPDIGVRGSVNVLTGAPQLNLINAGWDASISKSFGLAGVTQLTPYLGYQQLFTVASTRVLNAMPQDPRPPQTLTRDDAPDLRFAPEYVFDQRVHQSNRFFVGTRLNTWIMSFTLEAVFSERVQQFTFAGGVDF